jgi:hypothetical protein
MTLQDFGLYLCPLCDGIVPFIYCEDCAETHCEGCYNAYGCEGCE